MTTPLGEGVPGTPGARVVGQNLAGKAAICFRVTKFNNITENIIPSLRCPSTFGGSFFENYPILVGVAKPPHKTKRF